MPIDDNDSTPTVPKNLAELEAHLQALSHDDHAVKIIQNFAKNLGKTNQRQRLFNEKGAIVREPIIYQDVLHRGLIAPDEDPFILLQGDIVSTETGEAAPTYSPITMQCSKCGTTVQVDDRFCEECGTPLITISKSTPGCEKCGAGSEEINADGFCSDCGFRRENRQDDRFEVVRLPLH